MKLLPRAKRQPGPRTKTLVLACVGVCIVLLNSLHSFGFEPRKSRKVTFVDRTHTRITEDAFTELITQGIITGVTHISNDMRVAIKDIKYANAHVDLGPNFFYNPAHFVSQADIDESQKQLNKDFELTVKYVHEHNISAARSFLGVGLHALQDFYAHTNWVETHRNGNQPIPQNPDVGIPGHQIRPIAGTNENTCSLCGPKPPCVDCDNMRADKIVTSYFLGSPLDTPPPGIQCAHGGTMDYGILNSQNGGTNKDTYNCDQSGHWEEHLAAAAVAKEATKDFIRRLRQELTQREFNALLNVMAPMIIAIDTTGSMSAEDPIVKQAVLRILDARIAAGEAPASYILTEVSDPISRVVVNTDDPEVFRSAVINLQQTDGGDIPELAMTGLLKSLDAAPEGSDIFLFTDAGAKDAQLAPSVIALAGC